MKRPSWLDEDQRWPGVYVSHADESGMWEEWEALPTKVIVCPRCGGRGSHDCWEGGMTRDEMDEQGPEFFDDYMNGMYSVTCTECDGRNVIDGIDEDRCAPELLEAWWKFLQDEAADRHTRWAESGYPR